jgi:hypothetical protein
MKNWILLITFSYFGSINAQKKLDALTTPTSPASTILGMQPSAILQPKSYRALEAAVFSNFNDTDGNGIIPNNFGLEFMPYWANDHGISLEEYLYPKANLDQILRNSSFSLASTQKFLLQDSTVTKSLAFGYRTSLFLGNKKDKKIVQGHIISLSNEQRIGSKILSELESFRQKNTFKTKKEYLTAIREILIDRITEVLQNNSRKDAEEIAQNIYASTDALPFDTNNIDPFFISLLDLIEDKMMGNYDEFKSYIQLRQGLSIDFAYALFLNFPDNNFKNSEIPRQSLWVTPSYKFSDKISFLRATAVLRYEWYNLKYFDNYFPDTKVAENNFDYGIEITSEFKKFSLGFEATGRKSSSVIKACTDTLGNTLYSKNNTSDFQYIGTFSYRLTEQIALTYQIGSSFKPVFSTTGTLISLLSFNFGFGGPNVTDITSK